MAKEKVLLKKKKFDAKGKCLTPKEYFSQQNKKKLKNNWN